MPEIYVADLEVYNNGEWIDAAQDVEDIEEEIKKMLKESGSEEWEIHDSEGFGDIDVHGMSLDEVSRLAKGIEEYGEALPHSTWIQKTLIPPKRNFKMHMKENTIVKRISHTNS